MKVIGRLLLAGVAGTLVAGQAAAQDRPRAPYVTIFGGFASPIGFTSTLASTNPMFPNDRFQYVTEFDDGALVGAAIGFNLVPNAVRTELEFGRIALNAADYYGTTQGGMGPPISGQAVDGFLRVATLMANMWVTINAGPVSTYVGGGVGVGILTTDVCVDVDGCQFHGTTATFAYQVGAGVIFPLGPRVSMDLGYRFRGTAGGKLTSDVNNFDAYAGGLGVHVGLLGFTFGY